MSATGSRPLQSSAVRRRCAALLLGLGAGVLRERRHRTVVAALRLSGAGDRPGASRECADALRLCERDPALLTDAAAEALRAGEATTAAGYPARAVRVSPEAQRPRALLVALRMRAGDSASARVLLAEGLRLDPTQRRWRAMLSSPGRAPPPGR